MKIRFTKEQRRKIAMLLQNSKTCLLYGDCTECRNLTIHENGKQQCEIKKQTGEYPFLTTTDTIERILNE